MVKYHSMDKEGPYFWYVIVQQQAPVEVTLLVFGYWITV